MLWILACTSPVHSVKTTEETEETTPPDTMSCTASLAAASNLVIGLTWTPPAAGISHVEFGETTAFGLSTPSTTESPVHLDLVGNIADTVIYWRAFTETDSETYVCSGETKTGSLPSDLPPLTMTVNKSDAQDSAPYVIGSFFSPSAGAQMVAIRRDGKIVWYLEDKAGASVDMHYLPDGSGIVYNVFAGGAMGSPDNYIQATRLNGEELWSVAAPLAHHTFDYLEDGTILYQATDIRAYTDPADGSTSDWVGDALVEIPPGESPQTRLSTWDLLTPHENDRMADHSIYDGEDWTHGNLIRYHAEDDSFLWSMGHADDLFQIRHSDWGIDALFGVDGVAADPPFDYPHDPNWLPNGHLLMYMTEDKASGAIEYARNGDQLQEVWRAGFDKSSFALGQAERLSNGNTFVNYGAQQKMQEVAEDGTVVWEVLTTGSGMQGAFFAQFHVVNDLYSGD